MEVSEIDEHVHLDRAERIFLDSAKRCAGNPIPNGDSDIRSAIMESLLTPEGRAKFKKHLRGLADIPA